MRVPDDIAYRWIQAGMPTGTAPTSAEQWLDRCDAVLFHVLTIDDDGGEYIAFAYDAGVEVPLVPTGVEF